MESLLVSDYTVEVTRDYTPEFIDYISSICDTRSHEIKEKGENYTEERIRSCFNNGRFEHGFYIVKCKGVVVWTFGVDEFKGWGVICRMLRHNSTSRILPIMSAIGIPFVHQYLKNDICGICGTQNVDKRDLFASALNRRARVAKNVADTPDNIFATTSKAHDLFINHNILPYMVNYRNTTQQVYYYSFKTDQAPPFERV